MILQGKIKKGKANDLLTGSLNGWELVPHKAFKRVDPAILCQLKPLP